MRVVFIVREYSDEYLDGVIESYINSFAGPPWFERWTRDQVNRVVLQACNQQGFICKVVLYGPDPRVVGASLGYKVPREDTETVKFSEIYRMLCGIGWQESFYGAETFVMQEYQNQGVGTKMLREFAKDSLCGRVVFRTINPNQIKAREKAWDCKVQELFYDPVKKERLWYGVERNGTGKTK